MKRLQTLVCAALLTMVPLQAGPTRTSEAAEQFDFGIAMAQKGAWREAAFRFERSVKADPNNPAAQNNLGVAREAVGEFDQALDAYKKAAALDPKNSRIRENLDRLEAYMASRNAPLKPASGSAAAPAPAPAPPKPGGRS